MPFIYNDSPVSLRNFVTRAKRQLLHRRTHASSADSAIALERDALDPHISMQQIESFINRRFADTSSAVFRHMDREHRWQYAQSLTELSDLYYQRLHH